MAAKAWGSQQKAVEEVFFQNEAVSLCLLIHRRAKTMRVIDFRAGPSSAKRLFVLSLAQREGVEKVYTLVERDEVATWVKLGFVKEGNIPGFYKRSDAFLLGCSVPSYASGTMKARLREREPEPEQASSNGEYPSESGIRIAVPVEPEEPATTAAHDQMERTVVLAKRAAKELADRPLPQAKVATVDEIDTRKAVAAALRSGRALTAFEPFGRDVERRYFVIGTRSSFELVASTESQACFGNAFLEVLQGPKTEPERLATLGCLRALCDKLLAEGVVSCFCLAPSDDLGLATAFVFNGFRRTGLLLNHLVVGGERKDAIVWSRKLANPADE